MKVDTATKAKLQSLLAWNPAVDGPGFGETSEEEESEEEQSRREVRLQPNEETRMRKQSNSAETRRRKISRQEAETRNSADTRVPPLPDKGAYGEEPLGKMQRPTEKDFTHYAYHQPLKDAQYRETFEDLVTRTMIKTLKQEQCLMTEVDLSPTDTEEVSPSQARFTPTEDEGEQEERTEAPRDTPKKSRYTDCRLRTMSDPGTEWAPYNQQWRSGKVYR
jgi:hypothetical protein